MIASPRGALPFIATVLAASCATGVQQPPPSDASADHAGEPDALADDEGGDPHGDEADPVTDAFEDDPPFDPPVDTLLDTTADATVDTTADAPLDTTTDTAVDTIADTAADPPVDTTTDTAADPPADDGGVAGVIVTWDFATCPGGWSAASLGHPELTSLSWQCGVPTTGPAAAHGGSGSLWATRLAANYRDFEWSALTSPAVDLSGVPGSVILTFWHWYVFEWCTSACGADNPVPCALDGGNVEVWNGSSWVLATPVTGYPGDLAFFDVYYTHPLDGQPGYNAEGTQSVWAEAAFDVTAYRSAAFRVRFVFGSDSGVSEPGWYVDDITLSTP